MLHKPKEPVAEITMLLNHTKACPEVLGDLMKALWLLCKESLEGDVAHSFVSEQ